MKIDVEGAELKVLKGMVSTLKKPQLKLLIEVHVVILKEFFNTDYKDLLELLFQNGFSIKELKEFRKNKNEFREINGQSELQGNTMIYAFKS
ncbi:MAG: FkbM family methyltransferase [Sphingobacteriales bacterium]|nr:MAG: FkbM family methyltransferase [Sphingobacteriales bacterium]